MEFEEVCASLGWVGTLVQFGPEAGAFRTPQRRVSKRWFVRFFCCLPLFDFVGRFFRRVCWCDVIVMRAVVMQASVPQQRLNGDMYLSRLLRGMLSFRSTRAIAIYGRESRFMGKSVSTGMPTYFVLASWNRVKTV